MINADTIFKYYLNFINSKSFLRYYKVVRSYKKVAASYLNESKCRRFAYFNLKGAIWHYDSGRYTYLLIKSFHLSGFPVFIHQNYGLLSRLIKYKSLLLKIPFKIVKSFWSWPTSRNRNTILIKTEGQTKKIHLCFQNSQQQNNGLVISMPYLMHPMMYAEGYASHVKELRNKKALFRVMFAGNTQKKEYSRAALREKFNKTNRFEAIEYLKNNLGKQHQETITDISNLLASPNYTNKLLFVHSSSLKIPFKYWLPVMANTDFFLACSGSRMPMCHNVIEAMAVGSIPVLEYPEYFHPPLQNGYNCITYQGKQDLKKTVESLFKMSPEEINELKKNAISYYEAYLEPKKWVNNLIEMPGEEIILQVDAHLKPHKKEIPTNVYISEDSIPNLTNQKSL